MEKCYICNSKMLEDTIEIKNSWGKKCKVEKAKAFLCTNPNCGEITFSAKESTRLQNIARKY